MTSVGRPARVITDLGVLVPDAGTGELTLSHVHPGVSAHQMRKATGWPLRVADGRVRDPRQPTERELAGAAAAGTERGRRVGEDVAVPDAV